MSKWLNAILELFVLPRGDGYEYEMCDWSAWLLSPPLLAHEQYWNVEDILSRLAFAIDLPTLICDLVRKHKRRQLKSFCEHAPPDLKPYLPSILEHHTSEGLLHMSHHHCNHHLPLPYFRLMICIKLFIQQYSKVIILYVVVETLLILMVFTSSTAIKITPRLCSIMASMTHLTLYTLRLESMQVLFNHFQMLQQNPLALPIATLCPVLLTSSSTLNLPTSLHRSCHLQKQWLMFVLLDFLPFLLVANLLKR